MHTKCMMLKKCFWTYTKITVLKKGFLNYINNMPYHRETNLSHHAMSLNPLYIPSISIVSKLTIKNIADKQQKTNIVDNNVISVSRKYIVHM